MNKLFLATALSIALISCADNKKQEKQVLDEVIKIHDKVMASDELLMKNKMQLDSVLKQNKLQNKDTTEIAGLREKLTAADEAMGNWMHKFEPDVTGKSHTQIIEYMTNQKKQITDVDLQIKAVIAQSNQYLAKIKK